MLIEAEDLKTIEVQDLSLIEKLGKKKKLSTSDYISQIAKLHQLEIADVTKLFQYIEKVVARQLSDGDGALYIVPYLAVFPSIHHRGVKSRLEATKRQKHYDFREYLCKNRSKTVSAILDYKKVEFSQENKKEYHRFYWRKKMIKQYLENYCFCFNMEKGYKFGKVLELSNEKMVFQSYELQFLKPIGEPKVIVGNYLKTVLKYTLILNDIIL